MAMEASVESIKARLDLLEAAQNKEQELAREFRYRTDVRLENASRELKNAATTLATIVSQLEQWATIRKTLAWVGSCVLALGTFFGWVIHEIWPNGFWGGHGS